MVVPPWHATTTKYQELPTRPPINRIGVLLSVMVVQNQKGVSQMKGASRHFTNPKRYY